MDLTKEECLEDLKVIEGVDTDIGFTIRKVIGCGSSGIIAQAFD